MSLARRRPRWQRTPRRSISGHWTTTIQPIGFYSAYPGLSVQDIRALLADRKSQPATAVTSATPRGAAAMRSPGLLRRLHGRARHGAPGTDGHSAAPGESALDLADIQGFVLRGYRMPLVRHFLLAVRTPAEARRQLGRLVSGDESDAPQITAADEWHVGFAPGPGDDPAEPRAQQPGLLPQPRDHVAGARGAGTRGTPPGAVVQVLRRVRRRCGAPRGVDRRHRRELARELGRRLRRRSRSRPADAACPQHRRR